MPHRVQVLRERLSHVLKKLNKFETMNILVCCTAVCATSSDV